MARQIRGTLTFNYWKAHVHDEYCYISTYKVINILIVSVYKHEVRCNRNIVVAVTLNKALRYLGLRNVIIRFTR